MQNGSRSLELENDAIALTILLDKGADITRLVYLPQNIDVLWKTPWGTRNSHRNLPSVFESQAAWLSAYPGGWQLLFPNGGAANRYKNAQLGFHGEASMCAWDYSIEQAEPAELSVKLWVQLARSPYLVQRWLQLQAGSPVLTLHERITNQAGEPMQCMWSHHPAFGAPFISEHCVIDTGARRLIADDEYLGGANPLVPGKSYHWPLADGLDLSRVPGTEQPRDMLAYLSDFESGWYSITNRELGFGLGVSWDSAHFPYAWLWQEMHGSSGFPFYKRCYVMAIEPASSIPGQGLTAVMQKTGSQLHFEPGESKETTLRLSFFESRRGLGHVDASGTVELKERGEDGTAF